MSPQNGSNLWAALSHKIASSFQYSQICNDFVVLKSDWVNAIQSITNGYIVFCFGFEFDYSSQNFRGSRIWIDDTRLSFNRQSLHAQ